MKRLLFSIVFTVAALLSAGCEEPVFQSGQPESSGAAAEAYVTSADQVRLFEKVSVPLTGAGAGDAGIILKPETRYQQMDGFGAALSGSTCFNLLKMRPGDRHELLAHLFGQEDGLGYSCVRVSIGCSDFSLSDFSWCDEPGIENFAVHPEDRTYLFPILKQVLEINPGLKILGTPWSPPRWFKVDNPTDLNPCDSWTGGHLNPALYDDYALYFVKWIQAMEAEGVPIEAITIQNECLHGGNSASMIMTWQEQRDFIKKSLGPAFRDNNIGTKILIFDHNYNYDNTPGQIDYVPNIYADTEAARYIDGSAWHSYGGHPRALEKIHAAAPDKNIYFTESSIGLWDYEFGEALLWTMEYAMIGAFNRWCGSSVMWNLLLDSDHGPYRPGGCDKCLGVIDISSKDYSTLTRNSHYYNIAHMSRVVKPGAYRIGYEGEAPDGVEFTPFVNPDGSRALVAFNKSDTRLPFSVSDGSGKFVYVIPARSIVSFRWDM